MSAPDRTVREHARSHPGHVIEVTDTCSCGAPGCDHVVQQTYRVRAGAIGSAARRAERKRARQNRKRGRARR